MPNIKVYGVSNVSVNQSINKKKAGELSEKIKNLFKNESYAEHIVITFVYSSVKDLNRKNQPYIQLELDCMDNYQQKLNILKKLKMDIQVIKLHDFIPAK